MPTPKVTMSDFTNENYDNLTDEQKEAGKRLFSGYLKFCRTGIVPRIYSKACADYLSLESTTVPSTTIQQPSTTATAYTTARSLVTSAANTAFTQAAAAAVSQPEGSSAGTSTAASTVAAAATTVAANLASSGANFTTAAYSANGPSAAGGGSGVNLDCLHSINACIDSQLRASAATTSAPEFATAQPAGAGVLCYDAYMCSSDRTAALGHQLLGPFGLVLCLAALFSQLVFLALFRFRSVRSATSLYLSAMCLFDACACLLLGLLPVTHFLPGDAAVQRQVYHNFTVYLASIGQPLLEWVDLVSMYLLIVLFVQHRCGLNKIKFVLPTVSSLAGALLLYSMPKMFRYWFHSDSQGRRALRLTQLGADSTFQKIEDQLLKVPIELFIPYLTIGGFTCFRLYKRLDKYMVSKNTSRNRGGGSGEGNARAASSRRSQALSDDRKRDRTLRQEAVNADIVAMIGGLVFVCRFPNLVFHIVRSHGPAARTQLELLFYVVSNFLFVVCLLLKPVVYLGRGAHYRRLVRLFLVSVCGGGGGASGGGGTTASGSGQTINRSRPDGMDDKGPCGSSAIPLSTLPADSSHLTNVNTQQTLLGVSQSATEMADIDESRGPLLARAAASTEQPLDEDSRPRSPPVVVSVPENFDNDDNERRQQEGEEAEKQPDGSDNQEDDFNVAQYHRLRHQHGHLHRREHNSASASSDNPAFASLDETSC
ncbi:hypothetical protein BOX15_Mlig001223g2 [Macrostomum lignano]|uniref:G-protein coupled receptors family 1 profile domain-containing protein n=1 Tax=Macrostomum lignano TaxID=282301 RepID=A0A267FN64_9PLAT|nr:hypothetical protein BOX15_Mlig001223g2 [Macrostomum lignano]